MPRTVNLERAVNSAVAAGILAAICYALFIFALWRARNHDISQFIVLGALSVDRVHLPPGVSVVPDVGGYDGTAFYRFALDPFSRDRTQYGITLDFPAYRQQRIFYPLLVWILSAGQPAPVPWLLVLLNLAAVAALGGCGGVLSQHLGQHALWGILFPLYPGFLHSVARDLSEPVACALGLAGIVAVEKKLHVLASILLTLGVLARETVLLFALAYAVAYIWRRVSGRKEGTSNPVIFVLPPLTYLMWQLFLSAWWRVPPLKGLQAGSQSMSIPFIGYWNVLRAEASLYHVHRLHFAETSYIGIVAILAIIAQIKSSVPLAWKAALFFYFGLGVALPNASWAEDVAYMRILGEFSVICTAVILPSRPAYRWTLLVATGLVWYYLASHTVKYG